MYRVVQLNFTPEIELFYMLFERSLSIFSMTYLKQHIQSWAKKCVLGCVISPLCQQVESRNL